MTTTLLLTLAAAAPAGATSNPSGSSVRVVRLSVDGRYDSPLGLDNPRPTLAWQMVAARACRLPSHLACPADRQTGYEVQAAATVA
jgi:alpha-L-rhamnosidase